MNIDHAKIMLAHLEKQRPYPECNLPAPRHGHSSHAARSPTWMSWRSMRKRIQRDHYRNKEIEICERWDIYENFLADMGERPPDKTLGRIDNDGDYEPGNCRWETPNKKAVRRTRKKQASNRRSTVKVVLYGEWLTTAEACRRIGVKHKRVCERVRWYSETHQQAFDYYAAKKGR